MLQNNQEQIKQSLQVAGEKGALEAGHYYEALGQTLLGKAGWEIANGIIQPGNKLVLLIDDVHEITDMQYQNSEDKVIDWKPLPAPDNVLLESQMVEPAFKLNQYVLKQGLGKEYKNKIMFKEGWFPIQIDDFPTCVAMDCALTFHKWGELGMDYFVNILPSTYVGQQTQLKTMVNTLMDMAGFSSANKTFNSFIFN